MDTSPITAPWPSSTSAGKATERCPELRSRPLGGLPGRATDERDTFAGDLPLAAADSSRPGTEVPTQDLSALAEAGLAELVRLLAIPKSK